MSHGDQANTAYRDNYSIDRKRANDICMGISTDYTAEKGRYAAKYGIRMIEIVEHVITLWIIEGVE